VSIVENRCRNSRLSLIVRRMPIVRLRTPVTLMGATGFASASVDFQLARPLADANHSTKVGSFDQTDRKNGLQASHIPEHWQSQWHSGK
jgi:hypothetical protein